MPRIKASSGALDLIAQSIPQTTMNQVHERRSSVLSTNPRGWMAPAIVPIAQSPRIVPRINRSLQKVASVFAHSMSRAVSGVAMRLPQVSRDRSVAIASAPRPAAVAPATREKKT